MRSILARAHGIMTVVDAANAHKMNTPLSLFCMVLALVFFPVSEQNACAQALDHSAWTALLEENVSEEGFADYVGFMARQDELKSYLDYLGNNVPGQYEAYNERLAYYINLYNAATVFLILENYPLKSIRDLRNPWGKKWIRLGNDSISLNTIEHGILRKMNEPRIHFAINCASLSCPKLLNRAFTANDIELQLQQVSMDFIRDESRNRISENELLLSPIFKWYRGDFMQKRSLISFIQPFTEVEISDSARISYLPYDWSLNEKK